jgi:hypothetical protein
MANLTGARRDNTSLFFVKDTNSNIQYGLDWTDYLKASDSISSASVTISTVSGDSAPLALPTDAATDVLVSGGNTVYVRLEGGSVQNVYTVKVTIVTTQGDTDSRSFRIKVQEKLL